eukprot:846878-Rhodomonas_salina.1
MLLTRDVPSSLRSFSRSSPISHPLLAPVPRLPLLHLCSSFSLSLFSTPGSLLLWAQLPDISEYFGEDASALAQDRAPTVEDLMAGLTPCARAHSTLCFASTRHSLPLSHACCCCCACSAQGTEG